MSIRRYWIRYNKEAKRLEHEVTLDHIKPFGRGWSEVHLDICCNTSECPDDCINMTARSCLIAPDDSSDSIIVEFCSAQAQANMNDPGLITNILNQLQASSTLDGEFIVEEGVFIRFTGTMCNGDCPNNDFSFYISIQSN